MRRPRWAGTFRLGIGEGLYVGPAFDTAPHAHHALQLCVASEERLGLRTAAGGRWRRYAAALVHADRPHQLSGAGGAVALLYVDPEGDAGRRLGTIAGDRGIVDLGRHAGALEELLVPSTDAAAARGPGETAEAVATLLLGDAPPARTLDRRIAEAVRALRAARGAYPTSAALAARLGCSSGRFRHLFRAQVGIAYRSYLLWLRIGVAADTLLGGASLTTAAHAAGFADSAHLSRTFRRMFGVAPSQAPPFLG